MQQAGEHLVAGTAISRQPLTSKGADIQGRTAASDDAVGGHAGTGLMTA